MPDTVPFAVVQPYNGVQFDVYGVLSPEQRKELIDRGFRQDKMHRQRWYLANRPAPSTAEDFDDLINAAKHFAA